MNFCWIFVSLLLTSVTTPRYLNAYDDASTQIGDGLCSRVALDHNDRDGDFLPTCATSALTGNGATDYYQVDAAMAEASSIGHCCRIFTQVVRRSEEALKELQHSLQPVSRHYPAAVDEFGTGLVADNLVQSFERKICQQPLTENEEPRVLSCTTRVSTHTEACKSIMRVNSTKGAAIGIKQDRYAGFVARVRNWYR